MPLRPDLPRRAVRITAIVVGTVPLLITNLACGQETTMASNDITTTTFEPDDIPPAPRPPRTEELLLQSIGVLEGTVTSVDDEAATVSIESVLGGDGTLPSSGTIRVELAPGVEQGESGTWILGAGDPYEVLSAPKFTNEVGVRRLLEGKARTERPPEAEQIRALADRADVIAFARIDATSATEGTATVEEAIEGEADGPFAFRRGDGLGWELPQEAPSYGVVFLVADDDGWVAINDQTIATYLLNPVREALA